MVDGDATNRSVTRSTVDPTRFICHRDLATLAFIQPPENDTCEDRGRAQPGDYTEAQPAAAGQSTASDGSSVRSGAGRDRPHWPSPHGLSELQWW